MWKPRQLLAEVRTGAGMKEGIGTSRCASRVESSRGPWAESQAEQAVGRRWVQSSAGTSWSLLARSDPLRPPEPGSPQRPRAGLGGLWKEHAPRYTAQRGAVFLSVVRAPEDRQVWSSWFLPLLSRLGPLPSFLTWVLGSPGTGGSPVAAVHWPTGGVPLPKPSKMQKKCKGSG